MSTGTKVYAIGSSRNIGYHSSVRLLRKGATVTFLLRNASAFDQDAVMRPFIESGHARIVAGDALSKDDIQRGWTRAAEPSSTSDRPGVDILLFTVGGIPSFSFTKGFVTSPPDLVTRALLNTLSTAPSPPPARIVAVTVAGLSKASHDALPLPMRILYGWPLRVPHEDKIGMEEVLGHVRGEQFPARAPEHVLPSGWEAGLGIGESALAENVVVIRPALLTDGECRAEEDKNGKAYRVRVEADLPVDGGYTVSRRDVAHFIGEKLLGPEWDEYKGKGVSIAY